MDSNIPSFGMGTTIVHSAYQKYLELHDFVPIFLKFFWGRTPRPPFLTGISKGMFWWILALLKHAYGLFLVGLGGGGKITPPPSCWKEKKDKEKKWAPHFWNPGSATALEHIISLSYRTTLLMFTKLDRDEVLVVTHLCMGFSANSTQGQIQGRAICQNRSMRGSFSKGLLLQIGRLQQ